MYLPAGQIYRVEVCDSEEVTEMQRLCLIGRSTIYINTGILNVSMNALIVPNRVLSYS